MKVKRSNESNISNNNCRGKLSFLKLVICGLVIAAAAPSITAQQNAKANKVETRFGVQYRVMGNAANFGWHSPAIGNNRNSQDFLNQRFRAWLSLAPNSEVEGVVQVEMGHIMWGDNFEWTKSYNGPRFPPSVDANGDRVGIEVRRAFLAYSNERIGAFRLGIQDWHDAFSGSPVRGVHHAVDDYDSFGSVLADSIWDFNVGGVSYARKFPSLANMNVSAGWFALWEGDVTRADDTSLFSLDIDVPVRSADGIGFSTYLLRDGGNYSYPSAAGYASSWDLWVGARGKKKLGGIPFNAFVIFNTGRRKNNTSTPDFRHNGWAAKLEVSGVHLGPGRLSLQSLLSTGDDDPEDGRSGEFHTIAQSERDNFGAQTYWSYLTITSPHPPSDVNDLGVGLQNRGLGLVTVQARYAYSITNRFSAVAAAGWLRSMEANPVNGGNRMGTEIGNTFTLNLEGGFKVDFGAALLFTGDFYKTSPASNRPDRLWETFVRTQLEF